jgi:hypothetical protein
MGMASFNVSTTFVVFTLLCMSREAAGIEYLYHVCSNSTTFTPNSTYQSNLYQLLSSLSSNAGREDGFYNTTVGQNTSDTVYGLFLCRGDLSTQECQDCVGIATQYVMKRYCPIEKTAMIWYEECMIRYSDQSFFSTLNTKLKFYISSHKNISDPDRFNQLLVLTMNDLVSQVANVSTGAKKFATKEANFMGSEILYTLEQCTPDISSSDCNICIRDAISSLLPKCCGGLQGGRVVIPSCRIRYEIYPFYRMLNAMTPPPMPAILPPPPSRSSKGSGK